MSEGEEYDNSMGYSPQDIFNIRDDGTKPPLNIFENKTKATKTNKNISFQELQRVLKKRYESNKKLPAGADFNCSYCNKPIKKKNKAQSFCSPVIRKNGKKKSKCKDKYWNTIRNNRPKDY